MRSGIQRVMLVVGLAVATLLHGAWCNHSGAAEPDAGDVVDKGQQAVEQTANAQAPQWGEADGLSSAVVVRLHEWPQQSPQAKGMAFDAWPQEPPPVVAQFRQQWFAIPRIPRAYGPGGFRQDRSSVVLVSAATEVSLPPGQIEWLVRSAGLCRVWIDGRIVATTEPHKRPTNGHGPVVPYPHDDDPWLRQPRPGDVEQRWTTVSTGGNITVALEVLIGAPETRNEPGDITVAARLAAAATPWQVIGPQESMPLTDHGWQQIVAHVDPLVDAIDAATRRDAASVDDAFWQQRHQRARQYTASLPEIPLPETSLAVHNAVDRFLGSRIEAAWAAVDGQPAAAAALPPLTDDLTFLRRAFLDTVGVPPSVEEIQDFLATPAERRRDAWIERLLDDPRWADHWTSYWQDVLAENPNVIKPSLNNTGPFRWFLYEALLDHKPIDRWVTELIRMEGSRYGGGPAGFAMAAENDVPMAAKAHVLGAAFLGVDMQCARCHDAPYHDWKQSDLFALAAMLENAPLTVPPTSSVPKEFFQRRGAESLISVSTEPGQQIQPAWSLDDLIDPAQLDLAELGRDKSSREQLAALITAPENRRFAEVIVNRVWQRLMGEGLVEPLADWEGARPSDPQLLEYLGRQLTESGYDVRQPMRLIMQSHAYQRQAEDRPRRLQPDQRLLVAPRLRRMTAEQLVDSLHAVCGMPMMSEELTFDPESRMRQTVYLNLGQPRRAWQLTSLSNERDRPALSLPKAATLVECLEAFGWRGARQEPIEQRDEEPNVIQVGLLANGAMSTRLTRMTDQSPLVQVCIDASTPDALVEHLFLQILTRPPTDTERRLFVGAIAEGFAARVVDADKRPSPPLPPPPLPSVTWANHLHPQATEIMQQIERRVQAGPQPTVRLQDDWRQRVEDVVWALLNAPEMQFVP